MRLKIFRGLNRKVIYKIESSSFVYFSQTYLGAKQKSKKEWRGFNHKPLCPFLEKKNRKKYLNFKIKRSRYEHKFLKE